MDYKKISEKLFYCPNCGVQYANSEVFTRIRMNYKGYRAWGFMDNSKLDRVALIEKASTFPDYERKNKKNKEIEHPHVGFDTYPIGKGKQVTNIYMVSEFDDVCFFCGKRLTNREISIPISEYSSVYCKVKCCGEHFLIRPSRKIWRLLKDNPYPRYIKTNFNYYFNNYLLANETFNEKETYAILLLMKSRDKRGKKKKELALIVGNEEQTVRSDIVIIDYKEDETRQLLTDIFRHDKSEVVYFDQKYHVCYKKIKNSDRDLILDDVTIKSGGGYYSSIKNRHYELVDVLMYSPYTNRYEVTHATYDGREYMCFIDVSIYRAFIAKYGNPGIQIYPPQSYGLHAGFLNEESLLHTFGYTVNQKDNLSERARQTILAEVIDLEIMNPQSIVHFLAGCADRVRGKGYYEACEKYKSDIEFVRNYKVNTERFLICKF